MDLDQELQEKLVIDEKSPSLQNIGDFRRVMTPFGVNLPPPLCNPTFFQEYRILLAGSAAVKHFFPNDPWTCNDIDLFTFTDLSIVLRYLELHEWAPALSGRAPSEIGYRDIDESQSAYLSKGSIRLNVVKLCRPHGTDNYHDALRKLIQEKFDIDGCAVSFDGVGWAVPPQLGWTSFLNRKWKYTIPRYSEQQLHAHASGRSASEARISIARHMWGRMMKYIDRGFCISNYLEITEQLFRKVLEHSLP